MQHDVNVGAAIADVHDLMSSQLECCLEMIKHCDFSVSCRGSLDALNSTFFVIGELGAEDVIGRN